MTHTISDLNASLFKQLERLSDENLTGEQLELETKRAKPVIEVSKVIIENAALSLRGAEFAAEYCGRSGAMPSMLESNKEADRNDG